MIRTLVAGGFLILTGCNGYTPPKGCDTSASVSLNDPALEPTVWDDGQSTFFRFPGNARIPAFFIVNPDGKEATAEFTVDPLARTVMLHQTAHEIRMRDGDKVACIVNDAWNPVGFSTGTGTTNLNIVRDTRSTRR